MARAFRILAAVIALIGFGWAQAHAQVPMTGAGRGTPAAAPTFTGTGDVVSAFNAWWSPGIGYSAAYAAPGTNPAADVCDSGGTNCITLRVGTNGLVPAPSATACAGNPCVSISKLYDQSGASYCTGPCDLVQATNAARPLLLTNCGTGTMLCAKFTVAGFVLNGPTLPSISQPFSVTGVIEPTAINTSASEEILSTPCVSLYGQSNDGANNPSLDIASSTHFNNTTTLTNPLNAMYAATGVYNTTNSISSVNGTQQSSVNVGGSAWTGGVTSLGFAGCFTGGKYVGDVMEIGIKGAAFTGTDVTNVTSRQRTNWGF